MADAAGSASPAPALATQPRSGELPYTIPSRSPWRLGHARHAIAIIIGVGTTMLLVRMRSNWL